MLSLLIQYTLLYAAVLTLVALGGMFSERSGIINIGLEGIMVIGSLAGAISLGMLYGIMPGWLLVIVVVLISAVAASIYSLLLAVATVTFKADQTITGTALNLLSVAIAVLVVRAYNGSQNPQVEYQPGNFVFNIGSVQFNWLFVIAIACSLIAFIVLYKTRFGMRLMACGEHPHAADSLGINVYKMRYIGVLISGVLGGIGGIAYILPASTIWNFSYGVAGYGFLALAVMIFGQWKPIRIMLVSLLFGFFRSLAYIHSGIGWMQALNIPGYVYNCLPYIVSLVVLVLTAKSSRAPKAEGVIYDKGQR